MTRKLEEELGLLPRGRKNPDEFEETLPTVEEATRNRSYKR